MSYRVEQNGDSVDIVIDGWQSGISDSPYAAVSQSVLGNITQTGIADMRNLNIISIPTEASVGYQLTQSSQTPISALAFTVLASNDTFTYSSSTLVKVGTCITLNTLVGGTGLATATNYWVVASTSTTFTVSASVSSSGTPGAVVNVTADGSGTFTTVNLGFITQMTQNITSVNSTNGTNSFPSQLSTTYAIDDMNRAWVFNSATPNWVFINNPGTYAAALANTGIAYWKGYILVFRDSQIDYQPAGGAWTANWKSLATASPHRTFVDKNNRVMWCDGPNVGQLIQLTTFDPTTASTYTFNQKALIVDSRDATECIEQLGTNYLIGATGNVVYQWDGNQSGSLGIGAYTPIFLPENDTKRIVAVNTNAYIFAGNRGRIYVTNGANVDLFKKIPDHIAGVPDPLYSWGGAVYSKNQLYFGVSALNSASQTAINNYTAVWAISTDTNAMRVVNELSYGTYAGNTCELSASYDASAVVGSASFNLISLLCAWNNGTNYGVDWSSNSPDPYQSYQAYIDTDMIPVGTLLNPKAYAQVEFKLAVPLVAGENIRLSYRTDLSQAFTAINNNDTGAAPFNTTNMVSPYISGETLVGIQGAQWIQIRIEMSSVPKASNPSYCRLKEIRIR